MTSMEDIIIGTNFIKLKLDQGPFIEQVKMQWDSEKFASPLSWSLHY
jgi:hypothetical protein